MDLVLDEEEMDLVLDEEMGLVLDEDWIKRWTLYWMRR